MTVTDMTPGSDLSFRGRQLVLVICSTGLLVVGLDATVVNVALPAIHRSLDSSLAGLQWTVDAYTLVLASLLMLAGSTADRIGRKRVFLMGLMVFSLGSLLCALAPSLGVLLAARVLQAIGGSMLSPVAMSIIRNVFVDPAERARAIGVYAAIFGLSLALGPVIGGALVDSVGWRAVFLVNVPVGALAILATRRFVPESRAERPRRVDPIGQLLVILGLASLTFGIIEGPDRGWGSAEIVASLATAVVAFCRPCPLRAAAPRTPARGALLPQRPVLGRERDRGLRVRGAGGVSVPEHALPPGCARTLPAPCRHVHAADGSDGAHLRAGLGPSGRLARPAAVARRGRRRADRVRRRC